MALLEVCAWDGEQAFRRRTIRRNFMWKPKKSIKVFKKLNYSWSEIGRTNLIVHRDITSYNPTSFWQHFNAVSTSKWVIVSTPIDVGEAEPPSLERFRILKSTDVVSSVKKSRNSARLLDSMNKNSFFFASNLGQDFLPNHCSWEAYLSIRDPHLRAFTPLPPPPPPRQLRYWIQSRLKH